MTDESDRVWINIDHHAKTITDHCIRITKLEQNHLYSDKMRNKFIVYLLAGISAIQFMFLFVDRVFP